jgi:chromosome segregation ATPase
VELRDVAMKQKISLDGKEQIIGDLQSEIEELEMKNSSLEGSLCATQNEVSNLEAENKALFCSFEKVEETVRGYIHRCQDLEIQIQELTSAKDDLNQTCLILEARMKQAVQAYEGKVRDCEHVTTTLKETENFAEKLKNDIASLESKNANLHELMEIAKQTNATNEEIAEQVEISSTFYEHLFCTKVRFEAFL